MRISSGIWSYPNLHIAHAITVGREASTRVPRGILVRWCNERLLLSTVKQHTTRSTSYASCRLLPAFVAMGDTAPDNMSIANMTRAHASLSSIWWKAQCVEGALADTRLRVGAASMTN